jgi:hypothetical protein
LLSSPALPSPLTPSYKMIAVAQLTLKTLLYEAI